MLKKFFIVVFLFLIIGACSKNKKLQPDGVHSNAKWNVSENIWEFVDKENGHYFCWYKNGAKKTFEYSISKNKVKKIFNYYDNNSIEVIGQDLYINEYQRYGDSKIGWKGFGKWIEYYKNGKIKKDYCYSPRYKPKEFLTLNGKCGLETIYNKNGSIKKKINHKYKCKFGCEEIKVPAKYLK